MDADLQHDETLLPHMLDALKREQLDIVIGSRAVEGGSMGEFSAERQMLSNLGRRLSAMVCRTTVLDPMSGFFMLDRRYFEEVVHRLSGISFKILVDLLASATRPVLKLLDGTPAVVEKTLGDGRIIEVNVSPTTAWSDLPARPGVFVPLLYRVVGSIVDRRDAGLNITVGGRFSQHVPLDLLGKEAIIKSPDKDALPDSRRIELIGADATVTGPFTRRAGTYELDLPGQTPMLMAAQTDASESDLVALSAGDLEQLKQSVNVVECRIDTDLAGQIKQKRSGTELIFPLAILCLAIAVTESAMALWFSKSK